MIAKTTLFILFTVTQLSLGASCFAEGTRAFDFKKNLAFFQQLEKSKSSEVVRTQHSPCIPGIHAIDVKGKAEFLNKINLLMKPQISVKKSILLEDLTKNKPLKANTNINKMSVSNMARSGNVSESKISSKKYVTEDRTFKDVISMLVPNSTVGKSCLKEAYKSHALGNRQMVECNGMGLIMLSRPSNEVIYCKRNTSSPFASGGFKNAFHSSCVIQGKVVKKIMLQTKGCGADISDIKNITTIRQKLANQDHFVGDYTDFFNCGTAECPKKCFLQDQYDDSLYGLLNSGSIEGRGLKKRKYRKQIKSGVLSALEEMVKAGLTHGDIKPQNFFYKYNQKKDKYEVFLGDLDSLREAGSHEGVGIHTPDYLSRVRIKAYMEKKHRDRSESMDYADDIFATFMTLEQVEKGTNNAKTQSSRKSSRSEGERKFDQYVGSINNKTKKGLLLDASEKEFMDKTGYNVAVGNSRSVLERMRRSYARDYMFSQDLKSEGEKSRFSRIKGYFGTRRLSKEFNDKSKILKEIKRQKRKWIFF